MRDAVPDYSVSSLGALVAGLIFVAMMVWAASVIVAIPTGMHP